MVDGTALRADGLIADEADRFDATKAGITVGQEQRPSDVPAWEGPHMQQAATPHLWLFGIRRVKLGRALAKPQFHVAIAYLLLPSVGTLRKGRKGCRTIAAPLCLVGTEYHRAYNRERRSPGHPQAPRER